MELAEHDIYFKISIFKNSKSVMVLYKESANQQQKAVHVSR